MQSAILVYFIKVIAWLGGTHILNQSVSGTIRWNLEFWILCICTCRFSHETSRRQDRKRRTAEDNVRVPLYWEPCTSNIIIHIMYNYMHVHVCIPIPTLHAGGLGTRMCVLMCSCTLTNSQGLCAVCRHKSHGANPGMGMDECFHTLSVQVSDHGSTAGGSRDPWWGR